MDKVLPLSIETIKNNFAPPEKVEQPVIPEGYVESSVDQDTPIGKFIQEHGIDWMIQTLKNNGYSLVSSGQHKGAPAHRFLAPNSDSGSAGVVLFLGNKGKYLLYSHHGGHDPLAKAVKGKKHAHDAFDLFRILEHAGDQKDALSAIGVPVPWSDQELLEKIEATDSKNIAEFEVINSKIASSHLSVAQESALHRAISKKSGIGISTLRAEIKGLNSQPAIADKTLKRIGQENLVHSSSGLWTWSDQGYWSPMSPLRIKQDVHTVCDDHRVKYTSNFVDGVTKLLLTNTYTDKIEFNKHDKIINCQNGELSFDGDEWRLSDHCRSHFLTTQLPVTYDPEAKAHLFEEFLLDVFEGCPDTETRKALFLEIMGYSLLASCRYEKFLILVGNGANGKSVVLAVLKTLLGQRNVVSVRPSELDNRFKLAHLDGKLVNMVSEIAEGEVLADAKLKALVSGELQTAERKGKDPFEFLPVATHWFATNHLPHTRDFSDALFRRAEILEFPNQFTGEKCDPHLAGKLIKELPGILNLALAGAARLMKTGSFTVCESSEAAKRKWRLAANQVAHFVEDRCVIDANASTSLNQLYSRYERWAEEEGIRNSINRRGFGERLVRLGFPASKSGDSRTRKGIALKAINLCASG